jgi:hypothetical protein
MAGVAAVRRLDRIETKIAEIAELVLNARSELDRKRAGSR